MARHEVVFQDFAELATRLGLDAEALANGGTDETSAVEQEEAAPPEPRQPEGPDQRAPVISIEEQPSPVAPSAPDGGPAGPAPAAAETDLARLVAELAAA